MIGARTPLHGKTDVAADNRIEARAIAIALVALQRRLSKLALYTTQPDYTDAHII